MTIPTLFDKSRPGRRGGELRRTGIDHAGAGSMIPEGLRTTRPPLLPEVAERDLVSHYMALAHRTYSVDQGFYPLGSCTMKYNPKIADVVAGQAGLTRLHPAQPPAQVQGLLELLVRLETVLCELTGLAAVTFQPQAGAAGELTGLLVVRAWHQAASGTARRRILIPDTAHGTNPATAALAGYQVSVVPSDARGRVDTTALEAALSDDVAALMLTNPNTLGLFETDIQRIASAVHAVGAKLYYDGANLNAIGGWTRPGDMGFDVVHLNTHKTFATPHGGGGPGAGPVAVTAELAPFLPGPRPVRTADGSYGWETPEHSIGRVSGWHGNVGVLVRAYVYLSMLGAQGVRRSSALAVLNANYLRSLLVDGPDAVVESAFPGPVMHEFVLSLRALRRRHGVRALDVAKALIDHGVHPPTMYFPLVVDEALMVEPTETESPETLEAFAEAMRAVLAAAVSDPDAVRQAPRTTPVRRPDEARAARRLVARWSAPASDITSDPPTPG